MTNTAQTEWESTREDLERFMEGFQNADEDTIEEYYSYALDFSYVAPGTFNDQTEGYFRYQISYGGPSTEIRFYCSPNGNQWSLYRAEFWYLTWGDGDYVNVTEDEYANWVFEDFEELGSLEAAYLEGVAA